MEVEENKYSEGKIYKLVAPGTLDCFIGSTYRTLEERLYYHNYDYIHKETQNQCAAYKLYDLHKDISIVLIEAFPCTSKAELDARKRYHIEQCPDAMNKNIPGQTWRQRWEKNREHILITHREWVAKNSDKIAAYRASYAPKAKEKAKLRDALPENKAKRNAAKKVIVKCDICEKEMNKNSIWTHKNTVHKPPVST